MFFNLIRISRFPHAIRASYSPLHGNRHRVLSNINRLYSKDGADSKGGGPPGSQKSSQSPDSKKEKVNICITTRKDPYDPCDPGKKRPCIPSPPPYSVGPRKCPGPSKMDLLPKPDCPWDEECKNQNKKYTKHFIIGLLFSAFTLYMLWQNLNFTKLVVTEDKKKGKKTVFNRPKPTCRIPSNAHEIPSSVPYLLVGGGTASFSAFRAIKSSDPTAKVLVVSNECYFPYMRPPLSKEMWFGNKDENVLNLIFKQWNGTERSLFYEPDDFYIPASELTKNPNGGVSVIQGYTVKKIDVVEKQAVLDTGKVINYDKCLIATGGSPKNLDLFKTAKPQMQEKVSVYRDIFDFQELHEISKDIKSIAVIGGGFLGSEMACALGKLSQDRDLKVYQIYKESGNMGKILPEYLSEWTTNKVRREHVNIITNTELEDASLNDKGRMVLHLNNGTKLVVDHVVVAIGLQPNTELAQTSDLEIDPEQGGFLVNAEMEARSNLYVAGDCSCFYDIKLGRRRVEHHDHAVVSGRLAGENMTGAMKPYIHQSMFWSDLGPNVGFEAIGLVDSRLPTVAVFAKAGLKDTPKAVVAATDNNLRSATEELAGKLGVKQMETHQESDAMPVNTSGSSDDYGKGVIFYLRDDIVVGIVLWNVFNRMSIARQVLSDEKKYDDLNEVAKLFNIHEN